MNIYTKLAVLLAATLFISACTDETAPAPAPPAVKKKIVQKAPPVKEEAKKPEIKVKPYRYNPEGKRNPFISLVEDRRMTAKGSDRPLTALQKFDVGQIKVTGALERKSGPAAIMITPDGQMHIVRLGAYIGKNFGQVTSISAQTITITETFLDFDGTERTRVQEIAIKKGKDY